MNLSDILQDIGFNEKEAKIYLSALRLGQDTAFNIAKHSGIQRSTTYYTLEKLMEKGIASQKQTQKATFYRVVHPKVLLTQIKKKETILTEALPSLLDIHQAQVDKPIVEVFEGEQGIRKIYAETMHSMKKGKEILYFGSPLHYAKKEYQDILMLWMNGLKNKRHKAREILSIHPNTPVSGRQYFKQIEAQKNPNHQIGFMPKGLDYADNENFIYDNTVAIFSHGKNTFVTKIVSKNIATSYRNFFECAWGNTRKKI